VDRLGVSVANSLVIGLSSALGSIVPLTMAGHFGVGRKELALFAGIATFLLGVVVCGKGGRLRDASTSNSSESRGHTGAGYVFAVVSGVMSAIFNIGYSLALPIADAGVTLGHSRFDSTNCIWLLMLGAGAIPNLVYCAILMRKNHTGKLLLSGAPVQSWMLSALMGVLWGGSIFLYGAATPRLGELGTSVGWPLSLAVGLLVANLMGLLLGEWRNAPRLSVQYMRSGIALLLGAIVLCAISTRIGA
jgi:L-rhamnose-H+ transport protein